MLSAAHVLAMDAKNLLDVVDSIRMKYPEVNRLLTSLESQQETVPSPSYVQPDVQQHQEHGEGSISEGYVPMSGPVQQPIYEPVQKLITNTETELATKANVEQPIYNFATKVPPPLGPHVSVASSQSN